MSNEYPKALHKGNQKNFESLIAQNAEQEEELRENGYKNYSELPEYSQSVGVVSGSVLNTNEELDQVKTELLEALKKNEWYEDQLQVAQSEYIVKVNELQKENSILKFNAMDATELKEILDSKDVKYGSRDGKDVLVGLVIAAVYPEEGE
ncbi:hypothetical protein ACG94V_21100 [Acinetobacter sp. ULE_I001]|uniref:hypothetical protein n=1 Tax=unclassified Acinetobacter TaxID=196816 RepID=UPI003AF9B5EA